MRYDPDTIVQEIHAALERIHPSGSILASAPGVEIEVAFDGAVLYLFLDPAEYRNTPAADLGAAIVSAHRTARHEAISAMRQVLTGLPSERSATETTAYASRNGVTVVMTSDGFLESVDIPTWLPSRYQPNYLAQLVVDAIQEAERELT